MKLLLLAILAISSGSGSIREYTSPLVGFSQEWNDPRYAIANSAAGADYMSSNEKEVIHILNLARMNPTLFCNTVIKQYPQTSGKPGISNSKYYQSLLETMKNQPALNVLMPDKRAFESAKCHAETSGKTGYIGHDRRSSDCKRLASYMGECCEYGHDNPLDIVLALLIDENIPSLGHRKVFLSPYKKIGVSIQPHSRYRFNTVIDFTY